MQNTINNIFTFIIIALLVVITGQIFGEGMKREEIVECNKWEKQAETFPSFYLTKWQDDQCRAHGIVINTTVIEK